jgi:CubicO group peptidase (beta-lactamase class C family)
VKTSTIAAGFAAALLLAGCSGAASEPMTTPPVEPAPTASTETTSSPAATALPSAAPEELGFDPRVLDRLAQEAEDAGSTCLLVMRDGVVAGEWYWNDGAPDRPQEVFSVTKSITSTLVGLAQADGDLDLADPAADYIPEWAGTPSETVTVRNLLSNDSGRFWSSETDYGALIRARDRTSYAVGLRQAAEPGATWAYNNAAIQTLDRVISEATGEETAQFAQERLLGPLGMTSTRMTQDASGRSTQVFFGLQSTCPDLARFGQLFEQQGEWEGEQLVPREWVEDAVGHPSQELNAGYGLLWWVNRQGPQLQPIEEDGAAPRTERLVDGAPADLYAALGLGGQVVMVDPGSGTVVVRLGALGSGASPTSGVYSVADAAKVVTEALKP